MRLNQLIKWASKNQVWIEKMGKDSIARCLVCGNIYEITYQQIGNDQIWCPCRQIAARNAEIESTPDVRLYIKLTADSNAVLQCEICGHEWSLAQRHMKPSKFKCPKCKQRRKMK